MAQDPGPPPEAAPASPPGESKNAAKNEAKRRAKMDKFLAKQARLKDQGAAKRDAPAKKGSPAAAPAAEDAGALAFVNTTPAGEKKDLSLPMAASYNPRAVEAAWYEWWEKQGLFRPRLVAGKPAPEGTYVIPIPPPNVTGSLHLGHALTNSIQDTLVRYNRMLGKTALYVPGCDHAGIATQVVVEKRLYKEKKLTRHDLGREKFTGEIWKWKEEYGSRIYDQLRKLGSSYDWTMAKFTMDPELVVAVNEAFVRLHDEGIIYRANRLVNWCTKLKTALSNLEVENKELEGRTLMSIPDHDPKKKYEFGVLVQFAYQVEGSDEKLIVATTRIETMLGDVAIAVHPNDAKHKHLHGKHVLHPFHKTRLPIITDEMVDPEFGTGAVKITPAHDFNDYEVGKRHALPFINILNDDGTMNDNAGPAYKGMLRFDVREKIVADLKQLGLYVATENHKMMIPICGRSGNVVEPLIKPQWWVDSKKIVGPAMDAVRSGELQIIPALSEREWFKWLENIQDWCISRQLWWGHQVPAYLARVDGADDVDANDGKNWFSGRTEAEALARAAEKLGVPADRIKLERDPDVLDTWFSSGLWPFSIMGWPNKTKELELFYPNSLLETGWDILFFWVARMVMLGIKLTGQVPFKKVFCHAMVRDAHGRKMSKSLGNVIDPLDVIYGVTLEALHKTLESGNLDPREVEIAKKGQKEDYPNGIPECGTDALRFALCAYTSSGRDINLDILRVEGYRKFCNKLWNATRFAMMKLGEDYKPPAGNINLETAPLACRWILHKLNKATRDVHAHIDAFNFMGATTAVHQFWLYELCDVFIEVAKPHVDADTPHTAAVKQTLCHCLDAGLKLLHPFMPFVTEELWQRLPKPAAASGKTAECESISVARFPLEDPALNSDDADAQFAFINEVVHAARSLATDYNVRSNATVYVHAQTPEVETLLRGETQSVVTLVKAAKHVSVLTKADAMPAGCAVYPVNETCLVYILLKGVVNFDDEIVKLEGKLGKVRAALTQLCDKTVNKDDYVEKVKPEVREANDQKIKSYEAEIETLAKAVQNFMKLRDE